MAFKAKYPGKCGGCGGKIQVGQLIAKGSKGYQHNACPTVRTVPPPPPGSYAATARVLVGSGLMGGEEADEWKERMKENREYAQGVAEGERYSSDVKLYGRELAEEWEMEAEMARYNRGEDY